MLHSFLHTGSLKFSLHFILASHLKRDSPHLASGCWRGQHGPTGPDAQSLGRIWGGGLRSQVRVHTKHPHSLGGPAKRMPFSLCPPSLASRLAPSSSHLSFIHSEEPKTCQALRWVPEKGVVNKKEAAPAFMKV